MTSKAVVPYEDKKNDTVVKDFAGVNMQAVRTAIGEDEFSWLENMMPVGHGNLRCVPFQGNPVATINNVNIVYWKYGNISNVDYLFCFNSVGGGHTLNLSTFAVTSIAPTGTFSGTVAIAQWKNERILIVASNNYWSWDPVGGLVVLGGITGAPNAGSSIGTFGGRVWIGFQRTITISAPNSYQDFTLASAGASIILTDESLTSSINSLVVANNFVYVVGNSSFNVESDLRVQSGTPPVTLFSNTNLNSLIGTDLRLSIYPFGRTVVFATRYGFYQLIGSTPSKISDKLDNFVSGIDYTLPVSGGFAMIYNNLLRGFLVQYNSPTGKRPIIALNFNEKWFFASQGNTLSLVAGAFQGGTPAMFGTDGSNIWKLFSDTVSNINTRTETALWSVKNPTWKHQVLKAGVEATTPNVNTALVVTVNTDVADLSQTLAQVSTGQWINAAGITGQWQNGAGVLGDWVRPGLHLFQASFDQWGRYMGITVESTAPGYTINGFMLQHEQRQHWPDAV